MTVLEVGLGLAAVVVSRRARRRARAAAGGAERGLSREQIIQLRQRESMADFMQYGPRLSKSRKPYVLAVSPSGRRALLGGLGGLGVGQMWVDVSSYVATDPTFIGAPVRDEGTLDPLEDAMATSAMLRTRHWNGPE